MKTKLSALFLLFLIIGSLSTISAQVTIGSSNPPNDDALLDLQEDNTGASTKGLLMPRVALEAANLAKPLSAHVAGMTVYNTAISPGTVSSANYVSPGFYYNNGSRWERLHLGTTNWFYMPSIAIDVTTSGTFTRDLYLEYRKQFEDSMDSQTDPNTSPLPGTTLVKSPSAPNPFTTIFDASKLYFYVTGYDATVFSALSITADGKLTYTVDADNVSDATYMNIVFVEK
ncbi:MAG: hypothetical protein ACK5KL_07800 [Dysgonomonas sp.]|jgi:hypothetical protein